MSPIRGLLSDARLALERARYRFSVPLECRPRWDTGDRDSPYASVRFSVGGREALVCYGRPSARGRRIFGDLVPYGELWRTGANEPTTLHLPFAARIAGLSVPRGVYSIYTVPGEREWILVVNRSTRQSGRTREETGERGNVFPSGYTERVRAAELGRAPVQALDIEHVERLTIHSDTVDDTRTDLLIDWEATRVVVPCRPG